MHVLCSGTEAAVVLILALPAATLLAILDIIVIIIIIMLVLILPVTTLIILIIIRNVWCERRIDGGIAWTGTHTNGNNVYGRGGRRRGRLRRQWTRG
jgi:hypothetical protein